MTSVVICSKGRKLSLVTNTSKVFATCSMKLMQNFVLQAKTNKQTNKQTNKKKLQRPRKLTSTARSTEPIVLSTEIAAAHNSAH